MEDLSLLCDIKVIAGEELPGERVRITDPVVAEMCAREDLLDGVCPLIEASKVGGIVDVGCIKLRMVTD